MIRESNLLFNFLLRLSPPPDPQLEFSAVSLKIVIVVTLIFVAGRFISLTISPITIASAVESAMYFTIIASAVESLDVSVAVLTSAVETEMHPDFWR